MFGFSRTSSMRLRMALASVGFLSLGAASFAGAATLHPFAITTSAGGGSGGAQTVLQSNASSSAFQGEVASSANTSIKYPFGIFGEYNAPGGSFGIGVLGISTTGYAVAGESVGANPAMLGLATSSNGVSGITQAASPGNTVYSGVIGQDSAPGSSGVYGVDTSSPEPVSAGGPLAYGVGTIGESQQGLGGVFFNDDGPSTNGGHGGGLVQFGLPDGRGGAFGGTSGSSTLPAVKADAEVYGTAVFTGEVFYGQGVGTETFAILGTSNNRSGTVTVPQNGASSGASDVEANGDLYLTGSVYTNCQAFPVTNTINGGTPTTCNAVSAQAAVAKSSSGAELQTYASRHASPTMEDEGEARVVGGMSRVALDSAFASTISRDRPYMVFVTPEGDSALYVTNKTPTSFDVRQVGGGHGTLDFSYRIVARPYGDHSMRLAVVPHARAAIIAKDTSGDGPSFARLRAKRHSAMVGRDFARFAKTGIR
jgi:hypothetical protein